MEKKAEEFNSKVAELTDEEMQQVSGGRARGKERLPLIGQFKPEQYFKMKEQIDAFEAKRKEKRKQKRMAEEEEERRKAEESSRTCIGGSW